MVTVTQDPRGALCHYGSWEKECSQGHPLTRGFPFQMPVRTLSTGDAHLMAHS